MRPRGSWTLSRGRPATSSVRVEGTIEIEGGALGRLDTAGAHFLLAEYRAAGGSPPAVLRGFAPSHDAIVRLVERSTSDFGEPVRRKKGTQLAREIGETTVETLGTIRDTITFIGATTFALGEVVKRPALLRPKEITVQIELAGIRAIPIVMLLTFLIGVVVSYLFSIQAVKYGAQIFIVDSVGLAMCRELSPILVAVVLAGRSGSAFTAHIGSMKINEEIDAMRTMGLSPMHMLVLPRVLALMLTMPLLVCIGDLTGIAGGMLVADSLLDIRPTTFLTRLNAVIPLRSYLVGLIKAPVFALFIALIGCRLGLRVGNDARSLGLATTSAVVQGIVSVILLNAAFAIIFAELKL
jgi:phospholipid/cholesterol/gamma-HCH transport system permease protein